MANVGTTNVPSIDWSSGGPVAPSGQAVLAGVQQDYNVAFSASFNWNLTTPQGQLAGSTAAVVNNANQEWAWIATQVDPAYSTGRFQDAIGRISPGGTFARIPSAPTVLHRRGAPGGTVELCDSRRSERQRLSVHRGRHYSFERLDRFAVCGIGAGAGPGARECHALSGNSRF